MHISFGKGFYDAVPIGKDITFPQFVALCNARRHHGKLLAAKYAAASRADRHTDKDGPWFIAGRFIRPDRRTDCLGELFGFVGDFDNGQVGRRYIENVFGEQGPLAGTQFIAWTSYSHGMDRRERWRLFIPYTEGITPEQHHAAFAHFNAIFAGNLDASCDKPAQLWYLPGCPADALPIAQVFGSDDRAQAFDSSIFRTAVVPVARHHLPVGNAPAALVCANGRDANDDLTQRARPTLSEIVDALNALPKEEYASHDKWYRIGMAIFDGTGGSEQGRRIWDAWSQKVPGYDPALIDTKWRSFGRRTNGITVATLFHLAGQASSGAAPGPAPVSQLETADGGSDNTAAGFGALDSSPVAVVGNNHAAAVGPVQLPLPFSVPIPAEWRNHCRQDGTLVIQQQVPAPDGSGAKMWKAAIVGYNLVRVDSLDNQDDGANSAECEFIKPSRSVYATINGAVLGSPAELAGALCDRGVFLAGEQAKAAQELIMDWLKAVQLKKRERKTVSKWGWVRDANQAIKGFAAGGTVYNEDGTRVENGVIHTNAELQERYTPAGTLAEWQRVANFLVKQGRMPLVTMLATGFAAPLVKLSGLDGVLLSIISTKSGVGKSTAMIAGQSVWGSNLAMHSTDDTVNAFGAKMGLLQNLPCYWDDIKGENAYEKLPDLVYQITQGREKARMGPDRKTNLGNDWATMATFAANESIIERMRPHDTKSGTDATIARIFEIRIDGDPGTDRETPTFFESLRTSYGHAGAVYAEALALNHVAYKAALVKLIARLEKELSARPEERFWFMAVATLVLGATIARSLDLVEFDPLALQKFLCDQLLLMRGTKVEAVASVTPAEIIRDMIGDLRPQTVSIKAMRMKGPGSIEVTGHPARREEVWAMVSDDGWYRVRVKVFREWMDRNQHNGAGIIRDLRTANALSEGILDVGAKTQYTGPKQRCFEINLGALGL